MKSRDIVKAIGETDEKYLRSAEKSYNAYKAREFGGKILNGLKTVACALILIGVIVALWLPSVLFPRDPDPAASSDTAVTEIPGTEREETDTITDETEPVNTDENTQPAETSAPYDHTEFMTRGGLTYTEDGVEEFLTALRSSGLSYNTEREFMCRQVTPEGFYEKVGVKLFTVEDDNFIYGDGKVRRIGGGFFGSLLSAVPCDYNTDGVTDFLYSYSGGSGVNITTFRICDMTYFRQIDLGVLLYCDACIAPANDGGIYDIYAYGHVYPPQPGERIGYIRITETVCETVPDGDARVTTFFYPATYKLNGYSNRYDPYRSFSEAYSVKISGTKYPIGNLQISEDGVGEFCSALAKSGLVNKTVGEDECRQVTPNGFYEECGIRLFTVGDRSFVYRDGTVSEIGGGAYGMLLSAVNCDLGLDDMVDILYSYSDYTEGELRKTHIETYNVQTGEISRIRTLCNCDAFLVFGGEADSYDVYACWNWMVSDGEYAEPKYRIGYVYVWDKPSTDIEEDYFFDQKKEEEKYNKEHPYVDPTYYSLLKLLSSDESVDVNIKKICEVQAGEGDGYVGYYAPPGDDFCPSNFGIDDQNRVYIVDTVQKKLELFTMSGEYAGKIDLDIEGASRLTYAVISKGCVYAIYDDGAFYRFDKNGNKTHITDCSDYAHLSVSEKDGRVILHSWGSVYYVGENGDLREDKDYDSTKRVYDREKDMIERIDYSRGGETISFNVSVDKDSTVTGVINGNIVIENSVKNEEGRYVYKEFDVYSPEGKLLCSLAKVKIEGDHYSMWQTFIKNGKLYVMMCRRDHTVINEVTVSEH